MSEAELLYRIEDLQGFIRYLQSTRDDEWQTGTVRNQDNTKNCVMGHLVNYIYGKNYDGIITPAWDWFEEIWATTYMTYPVNDGKNPKYQQGSARERVIAYLTNLWLGVEKPTWQLWNEG